MQHTDTAEALEVIVIGAGQAGLAAAYHLKQRGVRFLVVDAAPEIGHAWRSRWDSLRLFTAAQYDALPGMAFPAPADTYPTKDEAADYLVAYAHRFDLPVLLNCAVERLTGAGAASRSRPARAGCWPARSWSPPARCSSPSSRRCPTGLAPRPSSSCTARTTATPPTCRAGSGTSWWSAPGTPDARSPSSSPPPTRSTSRWGPGRLQLPQRALGRDLFWWLTRLGVVTKTDQSPARAPVAGPRGPGDRHAAARPAPGRGPASSPG